MIRRFKLEFSDRIEVVEIKSEYSFGIGEAKKWIKEKHKGVKKITTIKNESII